MSDSTGLYNRRITLLYPSGTSSVVDGVEVADYTEGATVWAAWDVRPPKGKEIVVGEADRAIETRWIKIRYIDSIDASWRIRYQKKDYVIVSPPIDERMRHKELYLEIKAVG